MAIDVENLYTRYGPMVLRRCRAMLRQEDEAADAMQDVFVRLLGERPRLQQGVQQRGVRRRGHRRSVQPRVSIGT